MFLLLLFLYKCSSRVEWYFEDHAPIYVPCIGGLVRIEGSCEYHALNRALSNRLNW
jgi:hypothetical protein